MKTWFGLLLTVGTFMVGCASGYYAQRAGLPEQKLLLIEIRGCGSKSRDRAPSRQIGYGVKNPAADRVVGDDLPRIGKSNVVGRASPALGGARDPAQVARQ